MDLPRSGGILLHPTSLPGPFGIGDLGPTAHDFVDWLRTAGCKLWQILPLGPTGYGDSPYQCFSAFAGNPFLISPELLVQDGLLSDADLANGQDGLPAAARTGPVNYGEVIRWKLRLLAQAFQRFEHRPDFHEELNAFAAENAHWLEDYSLFMALKELHGGCSWMQWPTPIRLRQAAALAEARHSLSRSTLRQSFYQWLFYRQWRALRDHAHRSGLWIIGDIPMYAAEDSADLWAHGDLFQLDADRRPTVVAGVPPDYFSPTGQLWGNPLYRWDVHRRTGYAWWLEKLRASLTLVDFVRLDHFRGLASYWEVPAESVTAEIGRWVPGPGQDFLDTIVTALTAASNEGRIPFIAEDLGGSTPDVVALLDRFHLPGMKVLQFGFSGPENPFLPHNYSRNCVAYTGTHDNDTARGWLDSAPRPQVEFSLAYLSATQDGFPWDMIRAIWASVAAFAVVPMQDVLGLGTESRMNYPGRAEGNWVWRIDAASLTASLAARIRLLGQLYGR